MAEVSTIKQDIARQLDHLPPEAQRQVLDFVQALAKSFPKGVPGKQLLRFSGILEAEDIKAMTQAIEEGCERVDMNEW
ncbi:MAG: hypothetical protein OIN88_03165 [Candidatus Methanoperedens sp.]|nr:hypothetical protein [Candidatus Methanoperedens sp.]MCZ7359375.1 hypothetical protein [Candidatus Methanoperedens sp.]HLB70042.1 hypothetical protein [Candidatus Methanoperedens sp.]